MAGRRPDPATCDRPRSPGSDPSLSEILTWWRSTSRLREHLDTSRLGDSLGRPDNPGAVEALVVGHDGSWIATSTDKGIVRVWDVASGSVRFRLPGNSYFEVKGGGAAGWLATIDIDGALEIWDPATGGRLLTSANRRS